MSLTLYKDLVDDCSVACIPESGNVKSVKAAFLEKQNPFEYDADILKFAEGVGIPIWNGETWIQTINREEFTFDPASLLDTGNELEFGVDYWVYICMDGGSPEIVVSKNESFPDIFIMELSARFQMTGFGFRLIQPETSLDQAAQNGRIT